MYIKRVFFPVTTLGPGKRVGIWTTGCEKRCSGCMSPELQKKEAGQYMLPTEIMNIIEEIKAPIDGFTISGGEPFLQPDDLATLTAIIRQKYSEDIIVYTGYSLDELKAFDNKAVTRILDTITVLIDGSYIKELDDGKGIRGSSNQKIHMLRQIPIYNGLDFEQCERKLQSVIYDNKVLMVGIK